ncbi:Gtr1/RagA G protein conserved region-domain-containing protein [Phellopilus nigrolimitatus]|nr:Gtr1/RagA G protein conserved region-domain-containing protein [Phellopilus nigrolimitatus]
MPAPKAASTTHATTTPNNAPPTLVQNHSDDDEFIRTKILLLGLRRSGKTSIQQVLFDDLNPKQAFFVEPTTRLTKHKVNSFIPLEIWDCPGTVTIESLGVPLSLFTTIIFVIDIQDSYHHPIARLIDFFITAFQENTYVNLEVFVHKAEALSEDFRIDSFRHIQRRLLDELADFPPLIIHSPSNPSSPSNEESIEPHQIPYNFHLTSVYDHSLQDAFARVFSRILAPGSLPFLEELLNAFITSSSSSKAFLFDVKAKFFVATDSSPVDTATLGLCCDYVHMLNQFGDLYKSTISSPSVHPRRFELPKTQPTSPPSPLPDASSPSSPKLANSHQSLSAAVSRSHTPTHSATPSVSTGPAHTSSSNTPARSRSNTNAKSRVIDSAETDLEVQQKQKKPVFHPSSAASLTPYTTLVYHSITPRLALLALLPTSVWESKRGLVEYNIVYFREGVQEIYDVEQESRRRKKLRAPDSSPQSKLKLTARR